MRLASEFIRLPLRFDADRLLAEARSLRSQDLVSHPIDPLNLAAILISVNGETNHAFAAAGQMRPTALLGRCPYMTQVLASLQTPLSRTRLMVLPPGGNVQLHDDVSFHWFRRCRVHVPIITNPGVRFFCGEQSVHMGAGEAWLFDNFLPHRVVNQGDTTRIHLVTDTKGSAEFWAMVDRGENPFGGRRFAASDIRDVAYSDRHTPTLSIEPYAFDVLSDDEIRRFAQDILDEATQKLAADELDAARSWTAALVRDWLRAKELRATTTDEAAPYVAALEKLCASPIFVKLTQVSAPPSPADLALRVITTVFFRDNHQIPYAPDPGVAHAALTSMHAPVN